MEVTVQTVVVVAIAAVVVVVVVVVVAVVPSPCQLNMPKYDGLPSSCGSR